MTKSEIRTIMEQRISEKRMTDGITMELVNDAYILGMLDLAQTLEIISQDEREELLRIGKDQEDDETLEDDDEYISTEEDGTEHEYTVHFTAIAWGGENLEDETITVSAASARDALTEAEGILNYRYQAAMATRVDEEVTA